MNSQSITEKYSSLLIEPNETGIAEAADLLRRGELVAFPTETVYGLGANALNVNSVLDIFKAKGRPLTDPLIVHISHPSQAKELMEISEREELMFNTLTKAFWPGPLTLIVKASAKIPPPVTANTGFVGIRCPNHALAHKLIEAAQIPIAAPSANRFGHVSPTRAEHVLVDLAEKGVRVLNGESSLGSISSSGAEKVESCKFGIESTVIKLEGAGNRIAIFRQGAITQLQLEAAIKKVPGLEDVEIIAVSRTVKMHSTTTDGPAAPAASKPESTETEGQVAPGQAVTHYAPDVPCYIIRRLTPSSSGSSAAASPEDRNFSFSSEQLASKVVLVDYGQQYRNLADKVLAYRDLSAEANSLEAARLLFDTLRWSELIPGAETVLLAPIIGQTVSKPALDNLDSLDIHDMSLGVADRLFRAASGTFANVTLADLS